MSRARSLQGSLAAEVRHRPNEDHTDLKRELKAERLAELITKVVDEAPPLTADQVSRLSALLRGGGAA